MILSRWAPLLSRPLWGGPWIDRASPHFIRCLFLGIRSEPAWMLQVYEASSALGRRVSIEWPWPSVSPLWMGRGWGPRAPSSLCWPRPFQPGHGGGAGPHTERTKFCIVSAAGCAAESRHHLSCWHQGFNSVWVNGLIWAGGVHQLTSLFSLKTALIDFFFDD